MIRAPSNRVSVFNLRLCKERELKNKKLELKIV